MSRLWDKGAPLDQRVLEFTAGEDHALDNRLVAYDVRASIAHAEMLAESRLLSSEDLRLIRDGLSEIGAAHARGEWVVQLEQEDGQTALEMRLTERIGPAGARIHLGRSRNDQVLAALRLYMRDAVARLAGDADTVAESLLALTARQEMTCTRRTPPRIAVSMAPAFGNMPPSRLPACSSLLSPARSV